MAVGDWLPIHVDAEAAASSRFGERIAHGPLTFSLALGLIVQTGAFGDAVVAWLGLGELRAAAPVRIGDTIRVVATVRDSERSSNPAYGKAWLHYSVTNQHGSEVMTFLSGFLLLTAEVAQDRGLA